MSSLLMFTVVSYILNVADLSMETVATIWSKRKQERLLKKAFEDSIEKEKEKLKSSTIEKDKIEQNLEYLKVKWDRLKIQLEDVINEKPFIDICRDFGFSEVEGKFFLSELAECFERKLERIEEIITPTDGWLKRIKSKWDRISSVIRDPIQYAYNQAIDESVHGLDLGDKKLKLKFSTQLKKQWKDIKRKFIGPESSEFSNILFGIINREINDENLARSLSRNIYANYRRNLKNFAREDEKAFFWHVVDSLSDLEKNNEMILHELRLLSTLANSDYEDILKSILHENRRFGKKIEGLEETLFNELFYLGEDVTYIRNELDEVYGKAVIIEELSSKTLDEVKEIRKDIQSFKKPSTFFVQKANLDYDIRKVEPSVDINKNFVNRIDEMRYFESIVDNPVIVINGIPGIGKSALTAKLWELVTARGEISFWHDMSETDSRGALICELAAFFRGYAGDDRLVKAINSFGRNEAILERGDDLIHIVINILKENKYFLFFDNYHKTKDESIDEMFSKIITRLDSRESTLIFATREEKPFMRKGMKLVRESSGLRPLSREDSIEYVNNVMGKSYSQIVNNAIYSTTEGIPAYLDIVGSILLEMNLPEEMILDELQDIRKGEIEDNFKEHIIGNLNEKELEILFIMSVIRTPASKDMLQEIPISDWMETRNILLGLRRRNLIKGYYFIQNLLRELLQNEMSTESKQSFHEKIFRWYDERLATAYHTKDPTYLIEAIFHRIGAGKENEAADLFVEKAVWLSILGFNSMSFDICNEFHEEKLSSERWIEVLLIKSQILSSKSMFDNAFELLNEIKIICESIDYDEGLAKSLLGMAQYLMTKNEFKIANTFANKSLMISESIDDLSIKCSTLLTIGAINIMIGDTKEGLDFYLSAYEIARNLLDEDLKDRRVFLVSSLLIGDLYLQLGDLNNALKYSNEALESFRDLDDKLGMSVSMNSISSIYIQKGEYDLAITLSSKAYEIAKDLDMKSLLALSLHTIGTVYFQGFNKLDIAMEYFQTALDIVYEYIEENQLQVLILNNIASIEMANKQYENAYAHYKQNLELADKLNMVPQKSLLYSNLGTICIQQGNLKESKEYYALGLEVASQLGDKNGIATNLMGLGLLSNANGDTDSAFQYFQEAHEIFVQTEHILSSQTEAYIEALCTNQTQRPNAYDVPVMTPSTIDSHYCPQCSTQLNDDAEICFKCGLLCQEKLINPSHQETGRGQSNEPVSDQRFRLIHDATHTEKLFDSKDRTLGRTDFKEWAPGYSGHGDSFISREQFRIVGEGDEFFIYHLGANPTKLNGVNIEKGVKMQISDGDTIDLASGLAVFQFKVG